MLTQHLLIPLVGILRSPALYAVLGALVLLAAGVRPIRPPALAAFVLPAHAGTAVSGVLCAWLLVDRSGALPTGAWSMGLLAGTPLLGVLAGTRVALRVARAPVRGA